MLHSNRGCSVRRARSERDISVCGRCGIACAPLGRKINAMLDAAGVKSACLSVVFLSEKAMSDLNRRSLGHRGPTDVITFDLAAEGPGRGKRGIDGEIVICPDEARRNAAIFGEPVRREILRCIAHGILHLLGHDDATRAERELMRRQEDLLLR